MLSRRTEDYLRTILEIVEEKGYARVKDIAKKMKVSLPTVTEMLKKLDNKKLVTYEKYGGVTLTPQGKEIAKSIKIRHDTFIKFLKLILVPEDIAEKDAHELEHRLSPKTIEQLTKFVDFITQNQPKPEFTKRWLNLFKNYCESMETQ